MEDQNLTVTLTLDNDEELECDVLTIFFCWHTRTYCLLPLDENGEANGAEMFSSIVTRRLMVSQILPTSRRMRNTMLPPMLSMSGWTSRSLTSFWMRTRTSKKFLDKTGWMNFFPVFFFDITDREFLFSTCHGYIKESSLFFDLLVCHRFPVGNCSFQRLNDINTAVLQPLSPMHRQKCGLSFVNFFFFFHLPKLIRVDLGKSSHSFIVFRLSCFEPAHLRSPESPSLQSAACLFVLSRNPDTRLF